MRRSTSPGRFGFAATLLAAALSSVPAALPAQQASTSQAGSVSEAPCDSSLGDGRARELTGVVRHAATGRTLPGAVVTRSLESDASRGAAADTTNLRGGFVLCVPPEWPEEIDLIVTYGDRSFTLGPIQLSATRTRTDLRLQLGAPADVSLRVVDGTTGRPVPSARLELDPSAVSGWSDSRGRAEVRGLPPGRYALTVDHASFRTRTDTVYISEGRHARVTVEVVPEAVEMKPLEVSVDSRSPYLVDEGFYERRRSNGGYFMTPDSIANRDFAQVNHFWFVPGIRLRQPPSGCTAIYVDGIQGIIAEEAPGGRVSYRTRTNLSELRASQVIAIEAFRRGEAPKRFPNYLWFVDPDCQVVALWTQFGRADSD